MGLKTSLAAMSGLMAMSHACTAYNCVHDRQSARDKCDGLTREIEQDIDAAREQERDQEIRRILKESAAPSGGK